MALRLRSWWTRYGAAVLWTGVALTAVAALWRMGNEFPRLLWETAHPAAVDLENRHKEVQRWFTGLPVYGVIDQADYPPASYAMLWPLLGWLSLEAARWLWAITTTVVLAALAYLFVRESTARTPVQRLFVALLPFSVYATNVTVMVGQLGNHVLFLLVAGLVLLHRGRGHWQKDLLVGALVVLSLVKPTLSAPFFWVVLFVPGRLRPALLVAGGYAALTLLASAFQEADLLTLLQGWMGQKAKVSVLEGHANVHKWLVLAELEAWMMPVSLLILAGLGVWTWRHREADFWVLLGVTALVARLWIHHRPYDDLLLLIPMVTLFRLAKRGPLPGGSDVMAGLLLAATWATMLAPASLLLAPPPVSVMMGVGQSVVWLAVLAFLLRRAWHSNSRSLTPSE